MKHQTFIHSISTILCNKCRCQIRNILVVRSFAVHFILYKWNQNNINQRPLIWLMLVMVHPSASQPPPSFVAFDDQGNLVWGDIFKSSHTLKISGFNDLEMEKEQRMEEEGLYYMYTIWIVIFLFYFARNCLKSMFVCVLLHYLSLIGEWMMRGCTLPVLQMVNEPGWITVIF